MATQIRPAWILHGPAGSGKTQWIQQEAKQRGWRLFRWNVRNDRSLREGREVLHSQVRSQEKTCIWIEGADDLTQESQAFLRRILDTRSKEVQCVLEAREIWKLSSPILSRCLIKTLTNESSFRKTMIEGKAKELGLWNPVVMPKQLLSLTSLHDYKQQGGDPMIYLKCIVDLYPKNQSVRESLRRSLSGYSPWTQIAWLVCLLEQQVRL
jgi:hypothetical protein